MRGRAVVAGMAAVGLLAAACSGGGPGTGHAGTGDDCGLSSVDVPGSPATRDPRHPVSIVARDLYRTMPVSGYLAHGYVLAITDYEGSGTPGIHPYLVGESEGRSVIDAARAARQLPGVPDFFWLLVAGYAGAYPDLHPADILTPAGLRALDRADDGCFTGTALAEGRPMRTLVKPGFARNQAWQARLAQNEPGQRRADAPLLVLHSAADTGVPAFLSQAMVERMCSHGQTVERRVYTKGEDHDGAVDDAMADGLRWIDDRMAGRAARSTCR